MFADYKPYIHKKRNAYNGMEYLLVKTIANKLNMSISFESTSRETLSTYWEPMSGYKFCCVQLNIVTFFETKIYFSTDIVIGGIIHQMHNIWLFFIFVSGWICSFLVYLLSTVDSNYQSRHKRVDYFRALLLVTIPAYAATASKFKPANFPNRIIYWMLLTCPMFFQSMIGAYLYQFMKYQFYYHQITSVDEIVKFPFQLSGSAEVLNTLKYSPKVSFF